MPSSNKPPDPAGETFRTSCSRPSLRLRTAAGSPSGKHAPSTSSTPGSDRLRVRRLPHRFRADLDAVGVELDTWGAKQERVEKGNGGGVELVDSSPTYLLRDVDVSVLRKPTSIANAPRYVARAQQPQHVQLPTRPGEKERYAAVLLNRHQDEISRNDPQTHHGLRALRALRRPCPLQCLAPSRTSVLIPIPARRRHRHLSSRLRHRCLVEQAD